MQRVEPLSQQTPLPEFRVLDVRHYRDIEALRSAAESTSCPVLIMVHLMHLDEVLAWLNDKDDVCLIDSPPAMIRHRGESLRHRMERNLDPLTRVMARQQFQELLNQASENASSRQPTSLILCDIDFFKQINDEYGHQTGDQYLILLADALKEFSDRSATVGRIGGEEFAVVCNRDVAAAKMLAEKFRRKINAIQTTCGASTTASFGVATTSTGVSGEVLMEQACLAIYAAKENGRNCCISFREMEEDSRAAGDDVVVVGLQNQARVLAERVANIITMRSRNILKMVREEADLDGLTGCFTRRYLYRRLAEEFEHRQGRPLALAFLDLDFFGQVNKQHGWPTGDKLLSDICETLREHLREKDWVGRYGGEEFCVVMPNTTIGGARCVLSRIREQVESTEFYSIDGQVVPMTVSIGAAIALDTDGSFTELVDRASHQALVAKRSGRNQICVAKG